MIQDRDQYVHFTIKLLKGSFALSALWQDALNYHMIDQPDKLIALRLTEYYELLARGNARGGPHMQQEAVPHMQQEAVPPPSNGNNAVPPHLSDDYGRTPLPEPTISHRVVRTPDDIAVSSSSSMAEQNAEEAADYWSPL